MRPGVFLKVMKIELVLIGFGIICALCLPYYHRKANQKQRMASEEDLDYVKSQRGIQFDD